MKLGESNPPHGFGYDQRTPISHVTEPSQGSLNNAAYRSHHAFRRRSIFLFVGITSMISTWKATRPAATSYGHLTAMNYCPFSDGKSFSDLSHHGSVYDFALVASLFRKESALMVTYMSKNVAFGKRCRSSHSPSRGASVPNGVLAN